MKVRILSVSGLKVLHFRQPCLRAEHNTRYVGAWVYDTTIDKWTSKMIDDIGGIYDIGAVNISLGKMVKLNG